MFTVAQRDALRDRLLRLADADERVVAGAVVGSLAVDGGGDRFSDLDLTFGIPGHVAPSEVLDDWARTLVEEHDAVQLAARTTSPRSQARTWEGSSPGCYGSRWPPVWPRWCGRAQRLDSRTQPWSPNGSDCF